MTGMATAADLSLRSDVAHLYRRAAFGARPDELEAAVGAGYQATVDALVAQLAHPAAVPFTPSGDPKNAGPLVPWWVDAMATTATPVVEKLTLFWHGHFATSGMKVQSQALMYRQNDLFRRLGGGDFETLAKAVVQDGAMLRWLDGNTNQKAHPNENLGRELMELFTLGVGNFGETDVKEAARCLTGWRVDQNGEVSFAAGRHDTGLKTVLGQTGDFGADELVQILVGAAASARFIAARVYSHYARPIAPTDPVAADLAEVFTGAGRNIAALLKAMFLHPDFRSRATRTGLVKTPIEWAVGTLRAVGAHAPADIRERLNQLGQLPFDPPSVGGWGQNLYWLSTAASLARWKFVDSVASLGPLLPLTSVPRAERAAATARLLSVDGWSPSTANTLGQALDQPRILFALAVTSPEYLLA